MSNAINCRGRAGCVPLAVDLAPPSSCCGAQVVALRKQLSAEEAEGATADAQRAHLEKEVRQPPGQRSGIQD